MEGQKGKDKVSAICGTRVNHLSLGDIVDYLGGWLTEEEEFRTESHLGECEECAKKAYNLNYLRENFDGIWHSLTERAVAGDMVEASLVKELERRGLNEPGVREILTNWAERVSEKAAGALGIVVDASRKVAQAFEISADGLLVPRGPLSLATARVDTTGDEDEEGAPIFEARSIDGLREIVSDQAGGRVMVILELDAPWHSVTLEELEEGEGRSQTVEVEEVEGEDYLIAEFEGVSGWRFHLDFAEGERDGS